MLKDLGRNLLALILRLLRVGRHEEEPGAARDILAVRQAILNLIPHTDVRIRIQELTEPMVTKVRWASPELMAEWWELLGNTLETQLQPFHTEEWYETIRRVFAAELDYSEYL